MTKRILLAIALALSALFASGESQVFRVIATSVDADIYQTTPDPRYYSKHATIYLRTRGCRHVATEEPATVLANDQDFSGWLVFTAGDRCEVINAALDRGSL